MLNAHSRAFMSLWRLIFREKTQKNSNWVVFFQINDKMLSFLTINESNMKFGFFNLKKDNSCVILPKINKGSIHITDSGCFGTPEVKVTLPHLSVNNKKLSDEIEKEHTYTFKF